MSGREISKLLITHRNKINASPRRRFSLLIENSHESAQSASFAV